MAIVVVCTRCGIEVTAHFDNDVVEYKYNHLLWKERCTEPKPTSPALCPNLTRALLRRRP